MGGLISIIAGKVVLFDSSPLIYYLEEHPDYLSVADELFGAIDQGRVHGVTSVLTLLEILIRPLREGRLDIANQYAELLVHASGITLHPIGSATCEGAARLRAKYPWLRTPDALQVAVGLEHGAHLLVTNDKRWKRVTEIQVVVMSDYRTTRP